MNATMTSTTDSVGIILDAALPDGGLPLRWYALADAAQDRRLPGVLNAPQSACLFGSAPDTPTAQVSPHFVALPDTADVSAWHWIARYAPSNHCVTVLSSRLAFGDLFRHLRSFLDVRIGKDEMHLAFWDPAVLATLVGQPDDETRYVQEPILSLEQRAAFLRPVVDWWYWDRRQSLRRIQSVLMLQDEIGVHPPPVLPLVFKPEQIHMLVRATLPDRVLYELDLNRPGVLEGRDAWYNYALTCRLLDVALGHRILGLQDQVNFVGTGMILGERFHLHPAFASQLEDVAAGRRRFTEALELIPDVAFDEVIREPPAASAPSVGVS